MIVGVAAPCRLSQLHIRSFRAARDVVLAPAHLCALVGEANAGKSTLLAAIRVLLDPSVPVTEADVPPGGGLLVDGALESGPALRLEGAPPHLRRELPENAPEVVYLPAALRAASVVAPGAGPAADAVERACSQAQRLHPHGPSTTTGAGSLLAALEALSAAGAQGLVILIEEPELYLRPQAQRYLYRLLRTFAEAGNQVIYSTHAPAFLNVGRLEEVAFISFATASGIRVRQPEPLAVAHDFRFLTEFDAERSELFLSRAAVLVEGATEKLVFPFIFRALGHDVDRDAISIVECGGKSNIPLFAQVCDAAGVPFVAVHDRDAEAGRRPIASERAVNRMIADVVDPGRIVELAPDFERVAGLAGHRHKPERAWERFAGDAAPIPAPLARAVRLAVSLARD
jgi:ABC-type lipoprotein export system ATPase subunit